MRRFFSFLFGSALVFFSVQGWSDEYREQRERMVTQRIETAGVRNERVLEAMRTTPRHEFIPRALWDRAYYDMSLPIGDAQTISSPFIVAAMTETIDPQSTDKVLEIGTGSGYQAAVLSPLVKEVYTIEIVEPLGKQAERTLERLGYENVHVRVGDGFLGWPEKAPFDAILVTCSPEAVPQPLIDQLREGGKMVIPVGQRYQQTLYLLTKVDGKLVEKALQPTLFVPMTGSAEAQRQVQPDPLKPTVVNGDFQAPVPPENIQDPNFIPGWYYGRQCQLIATDPQDGGFVRFENDIPGRDSHLLQGLALDGAVIPRIRLTGKVRTRDVQGGSRPDQVPTVAISFYDAQRRDLGTQWLTLFRGTRDWKSDQRVFRVPPQTREVIVRIGLFGATGQADFDDIAIEAL